LELTCCFYFYLFFFKAFVVTSGQMYYDSPTIKAVLLARDITGAVGSFTTTGVLTATHSNVALGSISASCTFSGSYCIPSISVPNTWFNAPGTATLSYALASQAATPLIAAGTLSFNPSPQFSFINNVVVVLPQRPLNPNTAFNVNVMGNATKGISSFSLYFSSDPNLIITALTFDPTYWSASVTRNSAQVLFQQYFNSFTPSIVISYLFIQ
jgi:hypothetical protein